MNRPRVRPAFRLVPFLVFALAALVAGADAGESEAPAGSEPLQIAVAANFAGCLEQLAELWHGQGEPAPTLIIGSTGRHFAQIQAGAPFDLFLAADAERPRRLCDAGQAVEASRFTYAVGRLALWAPGLEGGPDTPWTALLDESGLQHLAIADPRVAPYGQAARQALQGVERWEALGDRIVTGRSVGQAWQFVASGAAEAGLLAYSQTLAGAEPEDVWPVPAELYAPIEQQAVLLRRAADKEAAGRFLEFLRSPAAAEVIASFGYRSPRDRSP